MYAIYLCGKSNIYCSYLSFFQGVAQRNHLIPITKHWVMPLSAIGINVVNMLKLTSILLHGPCV